MTAVWWVELTPPVLESLVAGDLTRASATAGVALTDFFVAADAVSVWRRRLGLLADHPGAARWLLPAAVVSDAGPVGRVGFHGPPDGLGMVEIGYSIDAAHRRRGYARAALREAIRRAAAAPDALVLRASIRPDNVASLATIAGFGFTVVGEMWDDEDGMETLYERAV
ncbi:GNAT family N-acetyltransferase [Pseudonocardia sp. GCM10023141]|uniref:GNAT family N-acetyltransferase n=1 Tax=Pseudonocardia sp. GCM10023141 TaxID=3252653 RepID=UPI003624668C